MTRYFMVTLAGLMLGGGTVWAVFMLTLRPSEDDFRVRAAGHYAQQMSHFGMGRLPAYRDCSLEVPDPYEQLRGISWVAECETSAAGTGYVYKVQLDHWARHRGEDFRVVPR